MRRQQLANLKLKNAWIFPVSQVPAARSRPPQATGSTPGVPTRGTKPGKSDHLHTASKMPAITNEAKL